MWSVPDGFKVAAEPENLDKSLVGSTVTCAGRLMDGSLVGSLMWSLMPPRACSRNSITAWSGGRQEQGASVAASLRVENYAFGADARLNSWVILEQDS